MRPPIPRWCPSRWSDCVSPSHQSINHDTKVSMGLLGDVCSCTCACTCTCHVAAETFICPRAKATVPDGRRPALSATGRLLPFVADSKNKFGKKSSSLGQNSSLADGTALARHCSRSRRSVAACTNATPSHLPHHSLRSHCILRVRATQTRSLALAVAVAAAFASVTPDCFPILALPPSPRSTAVHQRSLPLAPTAHAS